MDVEFKPPHQENGAKKEDSAQKEKAPPDADTNGTAKESPKHNSKSKRGQRRSRSRTPQQKSDDVKTLHVSLKNINAELNGKDLKEETEKTEERKDDDNVLNNTEKNGEEKLDKSTDKANQEISKIEKHSKKQKEENIKKDESDKKKDNQEKEVPVKAEESHKKGSPRKEKKDKPKKRDSSQTNDVDTETIEMDPLVVSDEPDPELQFDENSDMESGKGSPIISRCVTRRSQTRNIPTPKTPKSVEQDIDSEKHPVASILTNIVENDDEIPKTDNLNHTQDSMDTANLSTMVVIGSDVTRMDYVENNDSNLVDDGSYLNATRERSVGETLRCLSARRPIRPLDDYRRRALRLNQEKSDLNLPYQSAEQISTGMKRKNRSITPEDRKKFKTDSPGLNSLFSSPLANFRNKFRNDLPSSTPKLLGYRDGKSELHYNDEQNMAHSGDDEKKSWCSVM